MHAIMVIGRDFTDGGGLHLPLQVSVVFKVPRIDVLPRRCSSARRDRREQ